MTSQTEHFQLPSLGLKSSDNGFEAAKGAGSSSTFLAGVVPKLKVSLGLEAAGAAFPDPKENIPELAEAPVEFEDPFPKENVAEDDSVLLEFCDPKAKVGAAESLPFVDFLRKSKPEPPESGAVFPNPPKPAKILEPS